MTAEKDGGKTIRAFVAVSLPEPVKDVLRSLQGRLRDFGVDMKYTRPESIHLTLKFLGDMSSEAVPAANECLAKTASGFAPLTLRAGGLGVFPNVRRPRVLWTGIGGQTDALARLQQEIEEALATIGFDNENRRFKGHLTLGRFRHRANPERIAAAIEQFGGVASDAFVVDAVQLYESTLTPKGPIYKVLSSHCLAGK